MPYSMSDYPKQIEALPQAGKEMWIKVYNSAYETYKDRENRESLAAASAWAQVKTKYKNDDGKWVLKEADMTIYAEIIQEASRRGMTNNPKVQKIVAEGDKAAPEELASVLSWLKEQAVVKTEDGIEYPASSFAYVPDSDMPSEWKLRLCEGAEKKVTRAQLGRAAAALSPGGFRGQKVEIPSADLPSVKRKIRTEYRKLDVADEDIPRWVKEAEMRTLVTEYIPLTEAKVDSKGKATLTVIKPGFNSSKQRFYPAETLARDFKVFEGVKMYADHPTEKEEQERPERSIRDWVATLQNVRIGADGTVLGEATVVEPWMQERLATLRDKGMLKEIGISINAVGSASKADIQGVKTNLIERIVRARSVDFVTEAGAGGGVQLYEAEQSNLDIDIVSMETLKERRPDLVKIIETDVKAGIMQEVKKKMELEERVKELEGQNATLTTENESIKAKLTEADKAKVKAEAQAKIKEAVDKAELPDAAKTRLTERFKEAETDTGVAEAIKAEMDYITALAEAGKVKGLGGSKPDEKEDKEALKQSFKRFGITDQQAEIAANAR